MLGNIDKEKLAYARQDLEALKNSKFAFCADKHENDTFTISDLFNHLQSEFKELTDALLYKSIKVSREELADVSNMIDLLFMEILFNGKPRRR